MKTFYIVYFYLSITTIYSVVYCYNNCDIDLSIIIENKKWLSYNFVVDDCVVKKFITLDDNNLLGNNDNNFDFYGTLSKLDNYIDAKLLVIKNKINSLKEENNKLQIDRVKNELLLKLTKKTLNKQQLQLNETSQKAHKRVLLIETEIRDLMDKCLLNAIIDKNNKQITYTPKCIEQIEQLLSRINELNKDLESIVVFMEVESLLDKLHNNNNHEEN